MIEAGRHTASLAPETKMRPDRDLLTTLHNAGREEARRWIGRCLAGVGRKSTVDLAARFLGALGPLTESKAKPAGDRPATDAEAIAERL